MMREAEAHAEEDKQKREVTDARNQADGLIYQIEKTLNENREKIPASETSRIEGSIASLKKATEGEDLAAIRRGMEELQKASHTMAEALYKQAQGAPAGGGAADGAPGAEAGGQGGAGGDVIDAEVVDDKK
jgi:molecular chaperone DnaK